MQLSKSQVDKLGERLRSSEPTADDLRGLDEYRRSFEDAYRFVFGVLKARPNIGLYSRSGKSNKSIIQKLRRESLRLSQMQDISGCRVVVHNTHQQEDELRSLRRLFAVSRTIDRRQVPSNGYRAVHLVVTHGDRPVEIQIRTKFQHLWTLLAEWSADLWGQDLKYGGGDRQIQERLQKISVELQRSEQLEFRLYGKPGAAEWLSSDPELLYYRKRMEDDLTERVATLRQLLISRKDE